MKPGNNIRNQIPLARNQEEVIIQSRPPSRGRLGLLLKLFELFIIYSGILLPTISVTSRATRFSSPQLS